MTVLITGGSGFLGMELARALVEKGNEVVLFDVIPPGQTEKLPFVIGNISDWAEVCHVVKERKITEIFHLAAMLTAQCEANPWAALQVNGSGTYHVLEASRLLGVGKVIYASSMGTYGVIPGSTVDDETVQRPQTMYGVTKVFGELLGLYYYQKFGIDFRGVRFPQLVGPRVRSESYGQYIPKMIESAIQGRPFEPWVVKETAIPIMYIKDAVRALLEISEAEPARIKTRIYNIGQITPSPTMGELLEEIRKHFPDAKATFSPDPRAIEVLQAIPKGLDDQRARAEWDWSIGYGLKEMVEDFIKEFD